MDEAVAGFVSAPFWAQVGMVFFAFTAVVMFAEPMVKKRRFRRQYSAIVRGLGQEPPPGLAWPATAGTTVGGRRFEVRHDFRGGTNSGSTRGPHGYLLMTATRLAGERWPMHQVDISPAEGLLARLVGRTRATGDPTFDARFMVVQDGVPVRDGWLDAATRAAIIRFFDAAGLPGILSVREGELLFTIQHPWKGADGPTIGTLLAHQAELATVLERRG